MTLYLFPFIIMMYLTAKYFGTMKSFLKKLGLCVDKPAGISFTAIKVSASPSGEFKIICRLVKYTVLNGPVSPPPEPGFTRGFAEGSSNLSS
ncbi:MAG: hypothetical protein M0Q38_00935 [Bacteroidales bacterium]|nr:hypothetical protein [Bacteroidales bacterium]